MTKIAEAFQNKKAFIGFLTAGDPSLECTEEFIIKMEEAGAALIEIGPVLRSDCGRTSDSVSQRSCTV